MNQDDKLYRHQIKEVNYMLKIVRSFKKKKKKKNKEES